MSLFFITGLPRSRTAWLSLLLTHGSESFCHHDGLKGFSVKGLVHEMRESGYTNTGDSDSALLLHLEEVIRLVPDAKWVIVNRDPVASMDSYWKEFGTRYPGSPKTYQGIVDAFKLATKLFERAGCMLPKALRVDFEDLESPISGQKIWSHCLPGVEFPLDRWKALDTFRVNVIPQKLTLKGVC